MAKVKDDKFLKSNENENRYTIHNLELICSKFSFLFSNLFNKNIMFHTGPLIKSLNLSGYKTFKSSTLIKL